MHLRPAGPGASVGTPSASALSASDLTTPLAHARKSHATARHQSERAEVFNPQIGQLLWKSNDLSGFRSRSSDICRVPDSVSRHVCRCVRVAVLYRVGRVGTVRRWSDDHHDHQISPPALYTVTCMPCDGHISVRTAKAYTPTQLT